MANPMVPSQSVQRACKRGLAMVEDGLGGDGLEPTTIKEARSMANGEEQTEFKIRKGNRWWGRNARFLDEPDDSPAMVAAMLWGGKDGPAWFKRAYEFVLKQKENKSMNFSMHQTRQFNLRVDGAEQTQAGLKGIALAYGQLDSYCSVFAPGSGIESLDSFVANGSFLSGHDADDLPIGFIRSAVDIGTGIEVEVDYHSTDDALAARTVAKERLAAGKKVGLSIGFIVGNYIEYPNGEAMIQGLETMRQDLSKYNLEAIAKCQRECYLIMKIDKIMEVSQVNFPSVPESEASSVRKDLSHSLDGLTLVDQIESVLDAVNEVSNRAIEVQKLRSAQSKTIGKSTFDRIEELRNELNNLLVAVNSPTEFERQQAKFDQFKVIL